MVQYKTQFKSNISGNNLCLTATNGWNNVTSDDCRKDGTTWIVSGDPGNSTIQSQYGACLDAQFGPQIITIIVLIHLLLSGVYCPL